MIIAHWLNVMDTLPPLEHVVEVAVVSAYDGSLYRSFGCRTDTGDGWLWALARNAAWLSDADECEADDDYHVWCWKWPTPLPDAPPKGWSGSPDVIDPPKTNEAKP